jgi:transposase
MVQAHPHEGVCTHIDRAALRIRAQLITDRNAMANQLGGLLKLFGLRLGQARTPGKRAERLAALYRQRPDLEPLFAPWWRPWR